MILKDALENYYTFSGKTSEIVRQLGLAGIAVVWLFKQDNKTFTQIPADLKLPLLLIVVGLACDLLQYAVSTLIWGSYHRYKEAGGINPKHSFQAPLSINIPGITFFVLKILFIGSAYFYLLKYINSFIVFK
ncbi:hypothetical protein LK542_13385 [Massilia sp. IC2-477]|uniref:hypothetical protein n=1 Tax=Massilia sp. IC2-477 TaxID=2887198 RepID=UPI001D12AD97|nr:hypothetical protein [Massilia sp. IC2-477]MCC2956607.1 hypothetical protein [Massilia sp. IC2-477]